MKRFITLGVLVFHFFICNAQIGSLDNSFNSNGKLTFSGLGTDEIKALATQSDGKLILVGNSFHLDDNDISVVRLNIDGSFDNSFSGDGTLTVSGGAFDFGETCLAQSDGSILIAGSTISINNDHDILIVKVLTNGTLDPNFGNSGRLVISISSDDDIAYSITTDKNGKIYICGASGNQFFLGRLNSNGTFDNTFGSSPESKTGLILSSIGSSISAAYSICLQSDGKIIIGGTCLNLDKDFFVMRFLSSGLVDQNFGDASNGSNIIDFMGDDNLKEIKIDTENNFWIAGNSQNDFAISKLKVNGLLDTTFNGSGKKIIDIGNNSIDNLSGIALQENNSILLGGETDQKYAGIRLLTNGNVDANFGALGTSIIALEKPITSNAVTAFQNRIYLAGSMDNDFSVVALTNNEMALPLNLLSFYATGLQGKVILGWTTQNDDHISTYIVERSSDGKAFKPIGYVLRIPGHHNSSYTFTDDHPSSGPAHYRLRIQGHDETESFSKIILVKPISSKTSIIYPNPVQNNLQVVLRENPSKELAIYNVSGHMVKMVPIPSSTGNIIIPVDVSSFSAGTYFIRAGKEVLSFSKL